MDESVIEAVELLLLPDTDPLAAAAASETVIAWAHARQLQALHQVAREQPVVFDPPGALVGPAPAEVATTLVWSTRAAAGRLVLAGQVCAELPGLLAALRAGRDIGVPR